MNTERFFFTGVKYTKLIFPEKAFYLTEELTQAVQ
jgi:hypothetical protein